MVIVDVVSSNTDLVYRITNHGINIPLQINGEASDSLGDACIPNVGSDDKSTS